MSIECTSHRYGKYYDGMFLDFEDSEYYLICDNCGKRIRFEDFDEAVQYKKKERLEEQETK